MAELTPRSALADHWRAGRIGRAGTAPGVTLDEVTPGAMAQIAGVADGAALHAALAAYALADAPAPLRCTRGERMRLLWTGPGQYLAVCGEPDGAAFAASLAGALSALGGVAVDLSHARSVLRLNGPDVVDLLAKGCALDLEALGAGDCAPTLLSHFNVLLHREDGDTFELYVTRSFAVSCFEWLCRAGEEFGLEVR